VLALFPQGFQVIPLYALATAVIFGFALLAISYARSASSILLSATFGCLAIYLMINPAKASYSVAPTMVICALTGYLTAKIFLAKQRQHRLVLTGLVGLLIGLAVNFRLPNLFLSSGYFLSFFVPFLLSRKIEVALQGMVFGATFLAGMAPTLVANAINAGSPFATTYGGPDVTPPDLSFGILWTYVADMQFVAGACDCLDHFDVASASWQRHKPNSSCHGWKPCGESCLLSQPPRLHAVLYNSCRNAFVVECAVCLANAAGGNSGR